MRPSRASVLAQCRPYASLRELNWWGRMKRREFLTLAGAASVWPNLAAAQQDTSRSMPTVGFVGFADPDVDRGTATAFRRGMAELGYVEGQTIKIDARWSNGDVVRGHELIDALIALPVNVFLS